MKLLMFAITLLLINSYVYAQEDNNLYFEVDGTINADTGYVKLELHDLTEYYPKGMENYTVPINNSKFHISGKIPYPLGYQLSYGDRYYSSIFVIEPGYQKVVCDINASNKVPAVSNPSMIEHDGAYQEAYSVVKEKRVLWRSKWDSLSIVHQNKIPNKIKIELQKELNGYYAESDSVLLSYVHGHPDSYIAFWKFIYLFNGFGYEPIFDTVFEQFSDSLQNTYTGKILKQNLDIAGKLSKGKEFPFIAVKDSLDVPWKHSSLKQNKYTLIDFWYSNCSPCIAQFPHLKEIYASYQSKGFEVIAISTDRSTYKKNWQKMIKKYDLLWPQFWDIDGIESSKLSINKFPTNYLLDGDGRIIYKDIKPAALEEYLSENLN